MRIEKDLYDFLCGKLFSTALTMNITREKQKSVSRQQAIISLVQSKNVIHIGCSDHIGIIDEKIKNNIWLHKLLTETASTCVGIDIDKESIAYIKNTLKYDNVHAGNILTDDFQFIREKHWDYILFGEIVEHLDDPVFFLKTVREKYGKFVDRFIVSVPNVYCQAQFKNMLQFKEIINADHRFWFTPYTISKILVSAGYKPENLTFANRQPLTYYELAKRKVLRLIGSEVYYPYYYFRTLVISGTLT